MDCRSVGPSVSFASGTPASNADTFAPLTKAEGGAALPKQAFHVEWDFEMNTAITHPGLPAGDVADLARTNEQVRSRASSNLSRVTSRRVSKRPPCPNARVTSTQPDALQQVILQECFLKSHKRFVRIAYRILGNNEDAEDAVQDAVLSACRHLSSFEGRCAPTTWLTRIVMNAALMLRRKRKNAACWISPETDADMNLFADTVADAQPNPELAYSRVESVEVLDAHLNELNPLLREALVTTYYDELTINEASSALGAPPGTIKARLFRGRRLLRQLAFSAGKCRGSRFRSKSPSASPSDFLRQCL